MKSITIIIPVYNVEEYLGVCLDSVIKQELVDYEVILVNDGSTDKSGIICDEYAIKYSEIKVFHQENKGLSAARNKALREARGKYILFLDSDDFLVPNKISLLLKQANQYNLEILEFKSVRVTEWTKVAPTNYEEDNNNVLQVYNGYDYITYHNYNGQVWCYLIKTSLLLANNIFFPIGRVMEDAGFNLRTILSSTRVAFMSELCHCYRDREFSITNNKNEDHQKQILNDFVYAADDINSIIKEKKEKMSPECYNRCCSRRDNYLFFGAIRALKLGAVDSFFSEAKNKSLYPFPRLGKRDYPGPKYTIFHWCMMKPWLWKLLSKLYRVNK